MPENADRETESRKGQRRFRLRDYASWLILPGVLLVALGFPYAFLALAFWAADGSWDFEEDKSFRYWFFISGKRAEKLGVVAPTDKPVKYSVSESDGNFPGWVIVQYESKAAPAEVIEFYAKRCGAEKATVIKRTEPKQDGDKIRVELDCEFPSFHTAEFLAERTSSSELSKVSLRVWGRE